MRVTFWQPAGTFHVPGKGEFAEQFAPGAFDSSIGKEIPLKFGGDQIGTGILVASEVAEDGSSVSLTIEVISSPGVGWQQANPALGARVDVEAVMRELGQQL